MMTEALAAARWLLRRPALAAAIALALCCAYQLHRAERWKGSALQAEVTLERERSDHANELNRIHLATVEAQQRDLVNRQRVETLWRTKLEEAQHDLAEARSSNRAAVADFVRRQQLPAASGGSRTDATVPHTASLPTRPLHDAGTAIVPIDDLNRCADAFAQLAALIGAWGAAAAIDVNQPFNADAEAGP